MKRNDHVTIKELKKGDVFAERIDIIVGRESFEMLQDGNEGKGKMIPCRSRNLERHIKTTVKKSREKYVFFLINLPESERFVVD